MGTSSAVLTRCVALHMRDTKEPGEPPQPPQGTGNRVPAATARPHNLAQAAAGAWLRVARAVLKEVEEGTESGLGIGGLEAAEAALWGELGNRCASGPTL